MEAVVVFRALLNEEDVRVTIPQHSNPTLYVNDTGITIVSEDKLVVYASFPTGTPVFFSYEETNKKD